MIRRIFVEKKEGFDIAAKELLSDLKTNLKIEGLENVRIINRYDITGLTDEEYLLSKSTIFSEPPVDICYDEEISFSQDEKVFAVAFLDGQYDQRADSCEQCAEILTSKKRPRVKSAKVISLTGEISDKEFEIIKNYIINPVESREVSLEKLKSFDELVDIPESIEICEGFIDLDKEGLENFISENGFAMDAEDLAFCRDYFKNDEKRNPTITELKMIDTYWSDHCRHTTFLTKLENVSFSGENNVIKDVYYSYLDSRKTIYANKDKNISLMDIATIAVKELKNEGYLKNLDQSEEINACSIKIDVSVDGKKEPWLLMFKNETHNHPTEIEPFGGAATCLGGAIRDPLSGRAYVYSAMRITGSGDVTQKVEDTLSNKLPQRKITTLAAAGYSSYGNQVGVATGKVDEIYHPGYVAKRMELGAVVGAAPCENVVRERPKNTDVIILLGGRTGRDGIGGATGSSKAHDDESVEKCGAQVQKGNPPIERSLQRLFRDKRATTLIKRCNDFGAGGVSVAIGELADSLEIYLDNVPKKYDGLDGTEIAISESQERMAVTVAKENADEFIHLANQENLEATVVAKVTDDMRLKMIWNGQTIVNLSREFLNTNGVTKTASAKVSYSDAKEFFENYNKSPNTNDVKNMLSDLNCASKKGLINRFDSTIGALTVLMPLGGKHQLTEPDAMVSKLPVLEGNTDTVSVMAYGFDPYLSEISPFHGAIYSVVSSVSKVVATGGDYKTSYLTFQEYFEKLLDDETKWGKPLSALLGAYLVQKELKIASIGGKDSMSGTFNEINVPPTLVSFAITPSNVDNIISPEFKKQGSTVIYVPIEKDKNNIPNFENLKMVYEKINNLIVNKKIISAKTVGRFGVMEAVIKMCLGNNIGFTFENTNSLMLPDIGAFVCELSDNATDLGLNYEIIGKTNSEETLKWNTFEIALDEIKNEWSRPLEKVFPTKVESQETSVETIKYNASKKTIYTGENFAKPRVFIPVFPGTNCEFDTMRAFKEEGATPDVFVLNNLSSDNIASSLKEMANRINNSQMIVIPGGFSGGDEPDGSGKFIATAFKNPYIKDAINNLLKNKDGLMLGICNGFQALIKLGLVPFGEILEVDETFPTLTFNTINRHVSQMTNTVIASNKSPWFSSVNVGDVHTIPVSHGEGRFVANSALIKTLIENGQIATQYADLNGKASMDIKYNPNGSMYAVEGLTSPDGRVLGKMGHSERIGNGLYKNIPGEKDQKIFESGVKYFK